MTDTKYSKCRCGDENCNQYTMSTQGSVGFDLETAQLYAAAPDLYEALGRIKKASKKNRVDIDLIHLIAENALAKARGEQ